MRIVQKAVYDVGDAPWVKVTFRDTNGIATDPTSVTAAISWPSGVVNSYTYGVDDELVRLGSGVYRIRVSLGEAGEWTVRMAGVGIVESAAEMLLRVQASAIFDPPVDPGDAGYPSVGWWQITGVPSTIVPAPHEHAATDITSGTMVNARIAASNVTQHQAALSIATTQLTGVLQAAQFPAMTGDITSVAGALATTLANTAVTPGAYGSATQVPTYTVDAKGRVTAAANVAIAIAASQVTSGTLDNTRTTAASTNTVSAIVARDASGNFAAGTITATFSGNLTGNVTGNASGTAATITGALALANTPLTTRGDLLVATTATPILGRLAKGTQYQVLLGGATDPTWGAVDLSQATAITGTLPVGNGGTGATTLAGAGIVVGSASLTTANAIPIVASAGVLGQSDVMLASGIFSRAGTLGLSATGSNIITFSTVGSEAARITTGQNLVVGTTIALAKLSTVTTSLAAVPTLGTSTGAQFAVLGDGAAYGAIHGVLTSGQSFIQAGRTDSTATAYGLLLQPVGGNVLIGTTTDDTAKLQVYTNTDAWGIQTGDPLNSHIRISGTSGGATGTGVFQSYTTGAKRGGLIAFQVQGGNLSVGGASVGNYRLDVQSSGPTGTARIYDQTATTGVTSLVVRAGAGQSTTALTTWQNNAGTALAYVNSQGQYWTNGLLIAGDISSWSGLTAGDAVIGRTSGAGAGEFAVSGSLLYRAREIDSAGYGDHIFYTGATPTIRFRITADAKIGFFGVTPVARQTATADAASILALLQAYGLSN